MKETASIRVEHTYSQPPARVWRALTEPALIAKWWGAGDIAPIVGHRFDLDMGQWGKQPCLILAVEPEKLLKFKFSEGRLDTTITWELRAEGTGTLLTLTHEGFDISSPMARAAFDAMKQGWPLVLARVVGALD